MTHFTNLQDFVTFLEFKKDLKIIDYPVSTDLEITEISKRFLNNNGPALLFQNAISAKITKIPVLTNLFTSKLRIAWALGLKSEEEFEHLGEILAFLRAPTPPSSWKEILSLFPMMKRIFYLKNNIVSKAPSQEITLTEDDVDLDILPITRSWPKDVSPLITWPLVVSQNNIGKKDYNVGVYRLQKLNKNHLIVRWLKIRGGALHFNNWNKDSKNKKMPIAIVIGGPPALNLVASMPIPKGFSEYKFCSVIQSKSIELVKCKTSDLLVPAHAEIIIEGHINLAEYALEGPFGDHTGYYNEQESFPVMKISAITMKKNPIFLSTYTGKSPDEPSIIGESLNIIFLPIIKKQFPEITDLYLPPEACSYRIIIISINKTFPGQAIKIMMGVISFLEQFLYAKMVIVVDSDINIKNWKEVIWAISTRYDPSRDSTIINQAPMDYLDFASPVSGLGGKIFMDATKKISTENSRKWGEKIKMSDDIIKKIDKIWNKI
ncbi:MAG: UbiD family decarboxylase [Rickettsia sp.]|nr:UbiD family decarboxylase [Rickettsia sp.]